jgi:beta-glucuronidase
LPRDWKFRTDPQREGVRGLWFAPDLDASGWRDMQIGKFWDEQGVTHLGDAWYRLEWNAPAVPDKAKLVLWFGAVDETATVWVNGVKAGAHDEPPDFGWDKRFAIDVTGKLKLGELNTVAVKVGNSSLAGGIWKSVKLAVER